MVLTVVLLLADCAALALLYALNRPAPVSTRKIDSTNLVSLQGARLDSQKPACRLIHYTAKTCTFCAMENSTWLELKFDALAAKCDVISVVPNIAELPSSSPPDTALFVSTAFAKTFGATRTPTTVLTDPEGNVLWEKDGMMSKSDKATASKLLPISTKP